MITTSAGFYGNVAKNAKFDYALATLPYYPDVPGAPQNTVIGGASLWVMAGKKPAEYKGVAAFFDFISKPEVQSASHKRTGYLPITTAAYQLTEKSGFYKEKPGTDIAVTQMIRKVTDKSRGIGLGRQEVAQRGAAGDCEARQRAVGTFRKSQQVNPLRI